MKKFSLLLVVLVALGLLTSCATNQITAPLVTKVFTPPPFGWEGAGHGPGSTLGGLVDGDTLIFADSPFGQELQRIYAQSEETSEQKVAKTKTAEPVLTVKPKKVANRKSQKPPDWATAQSQK